MNDLLPKTLAASPGMISSSTFDRRMLILAAWGATLLLSKLPLVIARDLLGTDIPWITPAWIVIDILLIAGTYVWPVFKPLRRYFAIMGIIILLPVVLDILLKQSSIWGVFDESQIIMIRVLGDRVFLMLETLIVLVALYLMGVKRQEAFLAIGNMNAPIGGQVSTVKKTRLSWSVLGTVIALSLAGLFFTFLTSQNPAVLSNMAAVLPWLPLILLSAAMNAFGEEATFRAAPLATLLPAVGPSHAIWLTAIWFGLGHYYGGFPSGPIGLVYTGSLALILGKAMIDTRGMGWSWIIHMAIDTVIYIFFVATAV